MPVTPKHCVPFGMPPLSLYIHVPWCVKKCPYCDFNSHEFKDIPEQAYLLALQADFLQELDLLDSSREIQSIFIGGGTPSLLSSEFYNALLKFLSQRIPFSSDIEITLEANPGTVDADNFKGYFQAGINRLSIGVQSFSDSLLSEIGRIHNSEQAIKAFDVARRAGFQNINIDLMHGLPKQTNQAAIDDLETAISLNPEHLSWYQLTIEPNTFFYSKPPVLPQENLLYSIFENGKSLLAKNQYKQYEVSAYAKDGQTTKQAKHNLNYWQFGDYIGIGAGAHGKITDAAGLIKRRWKVKQPEHFINNQKTLAGERTLSQDELPLEFLMNALRLNKGFQTKQFEQRTGLAFSTIEEQLIKLQQTGYVELEANSNNAIASVKASKRGLLFLDTILSAF